MPPTIGINLPLLPSRRFCHFLIQSPLNIIRCKTTCRIIITDCTGDEVIRHSLLSHRAIGVLTGDAVHGEGGLLLGGDHGDIAHRALGAGRSGGALGSRATLRALNTLRTARDGEVKDGILSGAAIGDGSVCAGSSCGGGADGHGCGDLSEVYCCAHICFGF